MVRLCFWLLLTLQLAVVPWHAAHTQQRPAPQAATPATTQTATMPFGALSPEQARAALDTLNDPKKRAAFAATLEALVKGQSEHPPPQPAPPASPPANTASAAASQGIPIQLAPDSLGAQVLLSASEFLQSTANEVPRLLETMQSIPLFWGWCVVMVTNPLGQRLLTEAGWRLAVSLVLALSVQQALRILLRRPLARLLQLGEPLPAPARAQDEAEDAEARAERGDTESLPPPHESDDDERDSIGRRLRLGLARFALQMVPVLGLLLVGHMVAATQVGAAESNRLVILAVLDAIGACQTLLALMTLLFAPDPPGLQWLPMRRSAGLYLIRWTRRLILIGVPGYTIGEVALLLGLSPSSHEALQQAVGLVLMVCLGIIVVQRRRPVRRWLSAPPEATGMVPRLRNALARRWYGAALFFLAAIWLAWILRAPDAVERIIRYFLATALVVVGAAVARTMAIALLRTIEPGGDTASGPVNPARVRLGVYQPALKKLVTLLINVLAFLGLLQLYGLDGLSWLLTSDIGHRVASGVGTLVVTIGLAFAVWEGVNLAIQLHLERLRREAQAARSARLRTLLPLIHTTLAITVAVVAGLMVLSEIGVNIAPLLAGAGIVGVAIGFGSQKLVQDVITGVFLLLENTMQVGDVVKVGDQSGLVESLSVRTIRLRTEDGSVVVIPFSAVTTVINMTRDYSRAVIAVNVAGDEDVDRVIEAMRAMVREMREEDAWSRIILDELEVFGLDRITDTALQIRCRIMCTPFGRWPVGREFNRRLKARFAVVGIANPFSALRLLPLDTGPAPDAKVAEPAAEAMAAGG